MDIKKLQKLVLGILKYCTLAFGAFIAIIPVAVCIITAFKTDQEYQSTSPMTLPKSWTYFDNFIVAFKKANMLMGFRNTFLVLIVVLFFSIMMGTMIAYVLNRFIFRGNSLIRNLFLFAALLPGIATQVTVYKIMYNLNLINTLSGYMIVMMGTDVISIYIFLQFFENLPRSLDESAILDGCTYFGVFFRILLPLLKPAIITVMILKCVGIYNEYYMSNLYLQSKDLKTISTALFTFTGPYGSQYNYICAGVLITILPALIIFLIFQKQIYSGLTQGAVKG